MSFLVVITPVSCYEIFSVFFRDIYHQNIFSPTVVSPITIHLLPFINVFGDNQCMTFIKLWLFLYLLCIHHIAVLTFFDPAVNTKFAASNQNLCSFFDALAINMATFITPPFILQGKLSLHTFGGSHDFDFILQFKINIIYNLDRKSVV